MFKKNTNLIIIGLISVVNALGYGIIIPILYPYSLKFGLTDFQNSLLFALFSLCAFLSAPIIGRLSDKYGRKPLLVISIAGTAVSFFILAFAPSAIFLFLARALDGITAGNIPVVSAVISDTTEPKDRARGFAIIGASFGFGFVFGPAISAFTLGLGTSVPFLIAGAISVAATVITLFFLPETNKYMGKIQKGKLFDIPRLVQALGHRAVGKVLLLSFLYNIAFGILIFSYQPFSVKILKLSANQIALLFTLIGVIGLIVQVFLLQRVVKKLGDRKTLTAAIILVTGAFVMYFFARNVPLYIFAVILFAFSNSFVGPLVQTILSKQTDEESQGSIQGLNSSYVSVGNILGPIIGGIVATYYIPLPFLICAAFTAICLFLSRTIKSAPKEHAFNV